MILKIDHITYVVAREKLEETVKRYEKEGYKIKFIEKGLENVSGKLLFMKNKQLTHDIIFMEKENDFAVEIIGYDCVNTGNTNTYVNGIFKINVDENSNISEIFKSLKVNIETDNTVSLKGKLDRKEMQIEYYRSNLENKTTYLDDEGYGCITLLVDSIKRTREDIMQYDLIASNVSELNINGKKLYLFFVTTSTYSDLIVEFISPRM